MLILNLFSLKFWTVLIESSLSKSPSKIKPNKLSLTLTPMIVFVFVSSFSMTFFASQLTIIPLLSSHSIFPILISPSIDSSSPEIPRPEWVKIFFIGNKLKFCFFASWIKAFAIGCLLSFSKLAAIFSRNEWSLLFL